MTGWTPQYSLGVHSVPAEWWSQCLGKPTSAVAVPTMCTLAGVGAARISGKHTITALVVSRPALCEYEKSESRSGAEVKKKKEQKKKVSLYRGIW